MAYDEIIVGSGLSALAVALGLPAGRRVLVLADQEAPEIRHYDGAGAVPCAVRGMGGLGNYWHGVVSCVGRSPLAAQAASHLDELFRHFYPGVAHEDRSGWMFVPRQPVRPRYHWPRLAATRGERLIIRHETALRFDAGGTEVEVETAAGRHAGSRLWICCGALDTPGLIARSLGGDHLRHRDVADHAICYLGQIDRAANPLAPAPTVERVAGGYWLKPLDTGCSDVTVSLKPARFSYRTLDRGIEQRASFGLPTGGAVSKILRAGSLGLISEALFNKLGLFPHARIASVYGQIRIAGAYRLDVSTGTITPNEDAIRDTLRTRRAAIDIPGMLPSRLPDVFVRGIHLHDSLDAAQLAADGIGTADSKVRIADASTIRDIGGEHHSFQMMAAAYKAARQT